MTIDQQHKLEQPVQRTEFQELKNLTQNKEKYRQQKQETMSAMTLSQKKSTETATNTTATTKGTTVPQFEVQIVLEMELQSPAVAATSISTTLPATSATTAPTVLKLPAIESTIIDIPSSLMTMSCTNSLTSSSSSYDTDSSIASSTCCTRHGEHIYMERSLAMHQFTRNAPYAMSSLSSAATTATNSTTAANAATFSKLTSASLTASASLPSYSKTKAKYYQKSWPIFILLISIIEITIFVYDQFTFKRRPIELATTLHIPTNSVFIYRPDRRLQIWRFISYMFLHANWFHLGFNVVIQLFYGIPLEVMHGSLRVCLVYLAGVFAGSLGTSVVDSDVYLVGASGGVYALLAAHLANVLLNYAQMKYAVAQLVSVVIFVFCDIGYAFYTQYLDVIEPNKAPPVSYIAHLTGALAGLTIGLLVLKNFEQRAYENVIWWLALGVYSAFTIFAITFNLINTVTAQMMEEQGEVITQHLLHDLGVS